LAAKPKTHRQTLGLTRKHSDRAYDQRRMADPALARAAEIRGGARWKRFRAWHKRSFPLCCDPFGKHRCMPVPPPNETPEHIASLVDRPELAYTLSNVAPCCRACNAESDARKRRGEDVAPWFAAWRATVEARGKVNQE
jgi:hypothetical protein